MKKKKSGSLYISEEKDFIISFQFSAGPLKIVQESINLKLITVID